jgi:Domain of unknown function (DUF4129)
MTIPSPTGTAALDSQPRTVPLHWWPHITAVLLIITELGWIVPWYQMVSSIGSISQAWWSALVLGGVMLVTYGVAYTLESWHIIRNLELIVLGIMLALSLVFTESMLLDNPVRNVPGALVTLNPGAVLVLFFTLWLWWRGFLLARSALRPIYAWLRFELAILMFLTYTFLSSRYGYDVVRLSQFVLVLFFGLLSVVAARISYVGISRNVRKNPFDGRWAASTLAILIVTVALSAFLGSLLTGQYRLALDLLADFLKILIAAVIFILGIPGLLLSYLLGPIMPWLREAFAKVPMPATQEPGMASYPQSLPQPPPMPISLQSLCFWGLMVLLIVLILARVRRVVRGRSLRELDLPESLLKEGDTRRLMRKAAQDALDGLVARLRPARRLLAAARIRRIYAQLMGLCSELDHPRGVSKTPLEFLPQMGELFTDLSSELERITGAYVRVRYGEYPETNEEVKAIEDAWLRLAEEGLRLKRAGVGKLKTAEVKEIERTGV